MVLQPQVDRDLHYGLEGETSPEDMSETRLSDTIVVASAALRFKYVPSQLPLKILVPMELAQLHMAFVMAALISLISKGLLSQSFKPVSAISFRGATVVRAKMGSDSREYPKARTCRVASSPLMPGS